MKHRYIINIAGNDKFSWSKEVIAETFITAYVMAMDYLAKLEGQTIEQLRITSITELPS